MRHLLQHRTWRWVLLAALTVELAAIAYLVFNPSNAVPNKAIYEVTYALQDLGVS